MSRSIFNQKKKRLRTRRIIIVCAVLLLVAALIFGAVALIRGIPGKDKNADKTSPNGGTAGKPGTSSTDTPTPEPDPTPVLDPVRELPTDFLDRNTKAPRIALYDVSAQTLLYSKNGDDPCAPASLTKLMTALVALEYATPETVITAGDELYLLDPESSRAWIYIGHKLTLEQALYALLLPSGNDAAYVIAAQVGHLIDDSVTGQAAIDLFCQKMTEKAASLGCTNTTFLNPDGIDKTGHQSTANDMLKIALAAWNDPLLSKIVSTKTYTTTFLSGQTKEWNNSNKLMKDGVYAYEGACGMKTGTTGLAGSCLVSVATRPTSEDPSAERTILCVLLGAQTDDLRYSESSELLNLGFD